MKNTKVAKLYKSYPEVLPIFVALFISGILFSKHFSSSLYLTWAIIAILAFILSFVFKSSKCKVISVVVSIILISMFYGAVRQIEKVNSSDLLVLDGSWGTIYGRYTGQSNIINKNKISYVFNDVSYTTNNQTVNLPLKINCKTFLNRDRLFPEQYYSMTGKLNIISFNTPPVFEIASITIKEPIIPSIQTFAKNIQTSIKESLTSNLSTLHSPIVIGFILGDTSKIKNKSIFTETGISHILAISGQHIMVLIFLLASILHWFKIPPISRSIFISVILAFYALVTVGSPSVWRALIMYISATTIMFLESSSSPVRPVALAALIMLLYDPSLIDNAAFILSFTAVLSIIFLRQPFEYFITKLYFPKAIARYLAVTFAANIGTMPMVAYLFGTISLSSLFVNPLTLWAFTFILPIAFFITFFSAFSSQAAKILSFGLTVFLDILIKFLEYVKSLPGLYHYVGNIDPIVIVCIYSLMLFAVSLFNRYKVKEFIKTTNIQKNELETIHVTELPKEKKLEFRIEDASKVSPTLFREKNLLGPKDSINPLRNIEKIKRIDETIYNLKRIRLSNQNEAKEIIPVNKLAVESQNLYYRLFNMDEELLLKDNERLLQAQIFSLAIVGYELANRLNSNLEQPLSCKIPDIIQTLKDKSLISVVLADTIINSNLQIELKEPELNELFKKLKDLFIKSEFLLQLIMAGKNIEDLVKQHLILRIELVKSCWQFIKCDNLIRLKKRKNLR